MKNGNDWPQSTKPYRSNPPERSVGLVIPMRDQLKFFKLTYHSILDFTDYRYMLTVVDNMSSFTTRQYLDSIRRNHNVNILQYQQEHNLAEEVDLAIKFMFAFKQVAYGCVVLPSVIVEPNWLSRMINDLNGIMGVNALIPTHIGACAGAILFKRETYENNGPIFGIRAGISPVVVHRMVRSPILEGFQGQAETVKEELQNAG